jgi:hypothetical protein
VANIIDVTFLELTDAVMDVVAAVKSGAPSVDVEHLTPAERDAACRLLGLSGAAWRAHDAYKAAAARPRSAVTGGSFDFESAILDEQDARDGDYL